MSSLLQFNGQVNQQKGIGLMFYLDNKPTIGLYGSEVYQCQCGKSHEQLYRAWRKPREMFGPWVVFQYNGEQHIPDLSVPISVDILPKDAKPLSIAECSAYWHS